MGRIISDGDLQVPRVELARCADGKISRRQSERVAGTDSDVNRAGLRHFTRSMLLSQGQFAAFLNAKPKEDTQELLLELTGTEIYRANLGDRF
ncbi:hypothetical protein ACNKHW_02165 [Shigella flexneri]